MKHINQIIASLMKDESGQDLVEYALVVALISLGSVATMNALATSIGTALGAVGTKLNGAI